MLNDHLISLISLTKSHRQSESQAFIILFLLLAEYIKYTAQPVVTRTVEMNSNERHFN